MKRRDFLLSAASFPVLAALPTAAFAEALDYTDGLVKQLLAEGKTVFIDYKASWCSTCAAQERVINALQADNPAYEASIAFVNVDWDQFGRADIVKSYKVPRRSTLLVLKGDQELGRIVAGTGEAEIKALMDTALAAAVS